MNEQQQLLADWPDPATWETEHTWPCICGNQWRKCQIVGTRYEWRGPVSYITPWHQFQRTYLDQSLVIVDIDTLARAYGPQESYAVTIERTDMRTKRRSVEGMYAKTETRRTMDALNVWGNWIMIQDGNVPLHLDHYPVTHPYTYAPTPQVPSTWVDVLIYEDEWISFTGADEIREHFVGLALSREFIMDMGRAWERALKGS